MSFIEYVAYLSMAMIAVGVYLEVEGTNRLKHVGHLLTVISIVGLVYSGWEILVPATPKESVVEKQLRELKANQWPTLTPDTIETIAKAVAAVGRHKYDLVFNSSPDCLLFASGLRAAFDKANWTQVVETSDNAYMRAWSVPAPPGWAVNGFDDDAAMYALHDAIKNTLGSEIPMGRYSAPKDQHYISIRIGQKPFELQLSQNGNSN